MMKRYLFPILFSGLALACTEDDLVQYDQDKDGIFIRAVEVSLSRTIFLHCREGLILPRLLIRQRSRVIGRRRHITTGIV